MEELNKTNYMPTHEEFLETILEAIDRGIQNQDGRTDYCVADWVFQEILRGLPKITRHGTENDGCDLYEKLLSYRGQCVVNNM